MQIAKRHFAIRNLQSAIVLLAFFVRRVLPAEPAELAHLEPFRRLLLVLRRAVVTTLALGAGHRNDVSHSCLLESGESVNGRVGEWHSPTLEPADSYSTISVTVPAPTVRPPSRMAK